MPAVYLSTLLFKSLISTLPLESVPTLIGSYPPKTTLAGLVPWADSGIIIVFFSLFLTS